MNMEKDERAKEKKERMGDGRTSFGRLKGTKVYDSEGNVFGHVSDIEINRSTLSPTCLIIHKGFFGDYLRIDLKYVAKITTSKITLWISPEKNLVGTRVIDSEEKDIGRVVEAEKDRNGDLEYIRVEMSILQTEGVEGKKEDHPLPIMSFDDMTVAFPTSPLDEGPVTTNLDVRREEVVIDAENIVTVRKDKIYLSKEKESYI